jgi:hypothetical protein
MLRSPVVSTLAATVLAGFFLVAAVLLGPDFAMAEPAVDPARAQPRATDVKASLDAADELAAMEAIQLVLTEVGDGNTFVWYRAHGKLSGMFQPTVSFRDARGNVCRHLKVTLTSGVVSRKAEGVACRGLGGVWSLEG